MSSKRIIEIDYLRGFAMLVMIFLHTSVYFLTNNVMKNLWNYGHFAVPLFIFCSAYLFFIKDIQFNFSYLKKRFWRLLYPYYIFAMFFMIAVFVKEPGKINFNYIKDSVLTTGGVDLSWLVLLFLQLTFIIPFVIYLWKKIKIGFFVFFLISLLSSLLLIFNKWPYDYKIIMWLPYSLVIIYTMFFAFFVNKKWFYYGPVFFSGISFIILRIIMTHMHITLNLYDNKYPPNFYYLSYGIFVTGFIYLLAKRGAFSLPVIKNILLFLSRYSYSIFFIHYLILYILVGFIHSVGFSWLMFFGIVFIGAIFIQIILNRANTKIIKRSLKI